MAQGFTPSSMYRENFSAQSPGPIRQPPMLHRQPSRNFEPMRSQPEIGSVYPNEDHMGRYETPSLDRFGNPTMNLGRLPHFGMGFENLGSHTFNGNPGPFDNGFDNTMGLNGASYSSRSMRPPQQARGDIRSVWGSSPQQIQQTSMRGGFGRSEGFASNNPIEDQLIPTAIVIKNIPFALKKEELQGHMNWLNLPIPYAFNYHFDNGVFRGLAFANFTSAADTEDVINKLDGYNIEGRRLKVEYKKMLPQEERERIERMKREKRGQLEEQHRPMNANQLRNQASMSSMASAYGTRVTPSPGPQLSSKTEFHLDYNDPVTRNFFQALAKFLADPTKDHQTFYRLSAPDRRKLHAVAHEMGLHHHSEGIAEDRHTIITKVQEDNPQELSFFDMTNGQDGNRKTLIRAATMEFERNDNSLRPQYSLGQLGDNLQAFGSARDKDLQRSKSHAELQRGFTPSPVPSNAGSFTSALQNNAARYQQLDGAGPLYGLPSLTHASSNNGLGSRDDFLSKSFSNMNLTNHTIGGSPRRRQEPFSSFANDLQPPIATAPIGSNRTTSTNDRNPSRQPQGPPVDGGQGFERRNGQGRGSDELRRDMKGTIRADS
ncbi:MAG: hypothetical protein Q9227_007652 [Pyrenula ochraceoflavens]